MRDAERLVEVEVRHVATEGARLRQPEQGVQVRAVDVHLAAVLVHDRAQVGDGVLERSVCGGIGDHDRGEVVAVRLAALPEVVQVDRPVGGRLDDHDPHPGHHRRRRVGAVRTRRDQADVTLVVARGAVVRADGEQPGELALRPGVRLDRHLCVPGDLGQPVLQGVDQLQVAGGVVGRREGVQVGEAGETDGLHLGGGVELHRARAQRDHPPVEGVVPVGQPLQVPQQVGLGARAVEDRVGEVAGRAVQAGRDRVRG